MADRQAISLRTGAAGPERDVDFALPNGWRATVFPMQGGPKLDQADVQRAFTRPVGAEPISRAAQHAGSAVILVDDFRRPTPAQTLCHAVIDQLETAGLDRDQLTVVLGNGAHRIMTQREARRRLGTACDRVAHVVSHDAFSDNMTYVGLTSNGTPVLVNAAAARADFSVSISTVYPHGHSAWGGGAKMVLPGISHVSTTYCHHTKIRAGVWAGDPGRCRSRRDIEEAAALFGLDASVCAIVNGRKELCGLRVGDPTRAHRRAVKLARRIYDTDMRGATFDLVIANAYPFDGDPTQLSKGEFPARRLGVPILLVADFSDPSPWHGVYHGPRKDFLPRHQPRLPEPTDDALAHARIFLYSPQVGNGFVPQGSGWYCDNDWERLTQAMTRRFPQARVAVLPSAPLQIPRSGP